jgi:thymidine kinase
MYKKRGRLILISGPMYAGKTRRLISIYNELVKDNEKAIAVSPALDYRTKKIKSRNGNEIPTLKVESIKDLSEVIKKYNYIFIDEFHFFDEEIINIIEKQVRKCKTIVLSGLDKDYKGKNFESYESLREKADQEIKMTAICHTCGNIEYNAMFPHV